jgi:hypothetical protein
MKDMNNMRTEFPGLDRIEIASPCEASWDEMAGDDRTRFCRHCSLNVYNLSDMTRREAEAFVQGCEGRACIRFYRRADGTLLTRDCPLGLRAIKLRMFRSAAALAGMMAALVTGTLFGGKLNHVKPASFQAPSQTLSEWIEAGSTKPVAVMGGMCAPW